jgi:DNA-binding LytR/AlgR family response regulator
MNKIDGPLRAVVADDEPFVRAALVEQLGLLWPELQIVAEAEDGPQALRAITQHRPDIAFLDIRMPGLTGLQVAQLLDERTQVVFVTAYDNHALEAFEANAVDYVLKPLDTARLARVVSKLRSRETAPTGQLNQALEAALRALQKAPAAEVAPGPASMLEWLQVSTGTTVSLVHVDDVLFFESDTKYTRVVGLDCDGLVRTSLKELLPQLPSAFLQVHRSAIVNRHHVKAVQRIDDNMELELKGHAQRLRVSEAHRQHFKAM